MALFDAVEGANRVALQEAARRHARVRGHDARRCPVDHRAHPRVHALGTMGALAVVATAEQAERIARLLGAAAVADRPMKVFDDVKQARRWSEAQPPRIP
jgi:hypothetical protein